MAGPFYTYLWLRKDMTPYYAGKGRLRRAYQGKHNVHRPVERWRILTYPHASENEAHEHEKFLITIFGRKDKGTGILYNHTDGGEGTCGFTYKMSETHRSRIKAALTGRKQSAEHRANRAATRKGMVFSAEWRKKIGAAGVGRIQSEATKKKRSETITRWWQQRKGRAV